MINDNQSKYEISRKSDQWLKERATNKREIPVHEKIRERYLSEIPYNHTFWSDKDLSEIESARVLNYNDSDELCGFVLLQALYEMVKIAQYWKAIIIEGDDWKASNQKKSEK